jgi:hypothetical protein
MITQRFVILLLGVAAVSVIAVGGLIALLFREDPYEE